MLRIASDSVQPSPDFDTDSLDVGHWPLTGVSNRRLDLAQPVIPVIAAATAFTTAVVFALPLDPACAARLDGLRRLPQCRRCIPTRLQMKIAASACISSAGSYQK